MRLDGKLVGILLLTILIEAPRPVQADFRVAKVGDSLIDAQALTIQGGFGQCINGLSFQQDAVVTHGEHQYVAYYDGSRRVCLARRELPWGRWRIIRFADYDFQSNDAHNTISMGICPKDGTIHLAFDHHGHPLHYRVSSEGAAGNPRDATWDASLFGPVTSELETGKPIKITYPRFWQTPDGGLQFCYRRGGSGNGDRMLVDYDAETGAWVNTRKIDSGKGRVHVVMWHCTDQTLRAASSKPGEQRWGPPQARRYHHYWRAGDGKWHHSELPPAAGNRPKIFMDKSDNAYIIFGTRRTPAKLADGHLHSEGDLAIAAAAAASGWADWRVIHVEKGPFVNEMLGDNYRWDKEGVLSIMVQQSPEEAHQPTALRILDFSFEQK